MGFPFFCHCFWSLQDGKMATQQFLSNLERVLFGILTESLFHKRNHITLLCSILPNSIFLNRRSLFSICLAIFKAAREITAISAYCRKHY